VVLLNHLRFHKLGRRERILERKSGDLGKEMYPLAFGLKVMIRGVNSPFIHNPFKKGFFYEKIEENRTFHFTNPSDFCFPKYFRVYD
tara:strand:+ start:3385 stop:3645 length:261 start_codon:yes stop_codon:yes gene_type:complete